MANYTGQIARSDVPVSEQTVHEILQETPKSSVALTRMRRVPMSKKVRKQPMLSALPIAYWVNGDTGLKQTTTAAWKNIHITAEELAVLVPIPNTLVDDADIPLWPEVKPLVAEGIGLKIDQASLFGVDKPDSWPTAVIPGAIAAGNVVTEGTGKDLGVDVASAGRAIAKDGFSVNGFASEPGLNWELISLRDTNGQPIYHPAIAQGQPSTLYGYPLNEVNNGAWMDTIAKILAADWSKLAIGVRQDLTFDLFDQMVISDDAGKVVFNSAQQDSKVLRVVMRVGFAVANPSTRLNPSEGSRYPAGVVTAKSSAWVKTTAFAKGAIILAGPAILQATTAGTSGNTAPTAPAKVGETVTDGTVVWTRIV